MKQEPDRPMTDLLQKAFDEAAKLPASEQDALAARLLEDLADEVGWSQRFDSTRAEIAKLAEETREEYESGRTEVLDPDSL